MCGIRCFRKSWRSLECDRLKIQYKAHTVWEIFYCQPPAIWIMVCWLLWCLAASSIYCHLSPGTLSVSLVKYIPLSCFCSNLHYEPAPFSTGVAPQWLLYHSTSQSHASPTRSRFQPWGGSGALPEYSILALGIVVTTYAVKEFSLLLSNPSLFYPC